MKVAVIGSGISGLAAAWLINQKHQVTLYEAAAYLGGHTNTVDVELDGGRHPVDTGFLVHNELTYPNLIHLFNHLAVETYDTEMSFSVQLPNQDIEWAGSNLQTVFGQKRNLLRPRFLVMLQDILRFNRNAHDLLRYSELNDATLEELLVQHKYSDMLRDWYLLPMAAAIWSSSPKDILQFPAATFLRFCLNHHLLQVNNRPNWRTIIGGGRSYVEKMAASLDVRLGYPIETVSRHEDRVEITVAGRNENYDRLVFATHAPDTLTMLKDASPLEQQLLGSVSYQPNLAILHTDRRFLPKRKKLWSAWNYLSSGGVDQSVCVTYLLNKLQRLPFRTPLMVTLNPPTDMVPDNEIARFHYAHPVFDQPAVEAQKQLKRIQGNNNAWFCGAWCGYGFHEDGLKSALRIINDFGVEAPWPVTL